MKSLFRTLVASLLTILWTRWASGTHQSSNTLFQVRGGDGGFDIVDEEVVYRGWRTITRRKIRMRNGQIFDFDVRMEVFVE